VLVDSLLGEMKAVPEGFAALHAGKVGRYALIGLVGVGLFAYLAQRPVSFPVGGAAAAAVVGERAGGKGGKVKAVTGAQPKDGDHPVDPAARQKAIERLRKMLNNRAPGDIQDTVKKQQEQAEAKKKARDAARGGP
ncbi:MAG TPA: hypothetical protein VGO62_14765, partial [Myxococcota bacterium]